MIINLILSYSNSYKKKFTHRLFSNELPILFSKNKNDLKSFLLQSKKKISPSSKKFTFEYSSGRCTHIVAQSFEYVSREEEAKEIVSFMEKRQRLRLEANRKLIKKVEDKNKTSHKDKQKNPLITISGSPGIGKSTFLCHFPESKEYQNYCLKKSGKSPIVSTLTFNSAMSFKQDCFELRIIYGAINAMGLEVEITWEEFMSRFENIEIDKNDVISLLQELFGADRPILILIDEISKSQDDKKVMSSIGCILEGYDFVDVVVSSLSPNYIRILLSKSNRPIDYAVVYPLLRSELGKKECEIWANNIITKCGDDIKLDEFKVNILKNVYLLFSGHPRSIEIMKNLLEDEERDWSEIITNLKKKKMTFGKFLQKLVDMFDAENDYTDIDKIKISLLEEFVFRHPVTRSAEYDDFRIALENGKICIYSRYGNRFITLIPLQSILSYVSKNNLSTFKTNVGRLGAAYYFLNNIFSLNGVGIIWEKIVSLNIVIRSFEKMSISELFGIEYEKFDAIEEEYRIIINNSLQKRSKKIKNCNLFFPIVDDNHPGNDGLVVLNVNKDLTLYFYLQMKIKLDISDSKLIIAKVVTIISYNLLEYARNASEVNYDNVHMILYVWGLEKEKFENIFLKDNFPKEDMNKLVDEQFEKIKIKYETLPIGFDKETIKDYIDTHWDHFHFVGKENLQTWLSPSFISFPLLATALE